ncbi:syntaxin-1A-like isoform X2 [Leptotrombidium deliense]|uniref:Syntaxin-1A-like isoform X2 n=1 Tax=Leptotrombidium deliense TaxID=299467 RepID=A0A443RYM9_9ACAR|nr:syntaxin-1A-like isoform X2 [Leptotrombidium deliense]
MIKDRFIALRSAQVNEEDSRLLSSVVVDEQYRQVVEFLKTVEDIRELINHIKSDVDMVKHIHSSILSAPQTEEKIRQQLEDLISAIKGGANKVRGEIKIIEQNVNHLRNKNSNSADFRIKETQHSMLSQKLFEVMTDYNRTQADFRNRCKARIKRQLELTGKVTTNDELEQMLEIENPVVFTQGSITDTQQARQASADIAARYSNIMKLEKSIRELHDMFADMALLVEQQGEMIDQIENHVKYAVNYINKVKLTIPMASKYVSKYRRKKVLIGICLCICVLVFVVGVISSIIPW